MKIPSLKLFKTSLQRLPCFFFFISYPTHQQIFLVIPQNISWICPHLNISISQLLLLWVKTPLTLAKITARVSNWSPYFCSRHLRSIFHPAVGVNFKEHVRLCHFFLCSVNPKAFSLTLKALHDHPVATSLHPAAPTLHLVYCALALFLFPAFAPLIPS